VAGYIYQIKIHKVFSIYPADLVMLRAQQVNTISQLFDTRLSDRIDQTVSTNLMSASASSYAMAQQKMNSLHCKLSKMTPQE
jgi:hypothetical protein